MADKKYVTYEQAEDLLKDAYMKGRPLDIKQLYDALLESPYGYGMPAEADTDLWGIISDDEFREKMSRARFLLVDPTSVPAEEHLRVTEDSLFSVHEDYHEVMMHRQYNYLLEHAHSHDYIEVYYVMQGSCVVHFEGRSIELRGGDMLFIAAHATHYLESDSGDSFILDLSVRSSGFEKLFMKQLALDSILSSFFRNIIYGTPGLKYILFHTHGDERIKIALKNIAMETFSADPFNEITLSSWANIIFSILIRNYYEDVETDPPIDRDDFSRILRYVTDHYDTVTLDELSEKFSYSKPHICNLIKTNTGRTLTDLINAQKLAKAELLLKNTDCSIEEIASRIGFTSADYFTRLFKKNYGTTPGRFRKG